MAAKKESFVKLADKLAALAAARGRKHYEIARAIKQDPPRVSLYMNGKATPSTREVAEIARYLDVPAWYFTDDDTAVQPLPEPGQGGGMALTEDEMIVVRLMRQFGADRVMGRLMAFDEPAVVGPRPVESAGHPAPPPPSAARKNGQGA